MSVYLGDFVEDATVRFAWNSNAVAGESVTRGTDGTVSVYKDGGVSQSTAGVTDTEDFDGLTGVHLCAIDTSADAFYVTGSEYMVVLSGATIDGKAINAVLAHFSIEREQASGSAPTAAAVADAVWDEALSGHTTAGSAGERLGRLPNAAAGAAGGLWVLGANAAAATTLTGSAGNPALLLTGGSNSHGMSLAGAGTGSGLNAVGGATGHGYRGTGGSSIGHGMFLSGDASGGGLVVQGTGGNGDIILAGQFAPTLYAAAFLSDTGETYATAVAGSLVKEIVDNTPGGTGASLDDIADAVWDELLAGHVTAGSAAVVLSDLPTAAEFFTVNTGQTYAGSVAGSVVKEIADNAGGGAGDPLENQVPGSYASGTAGHRLGMLGGVKVTVVSPVADTGEVSLVRGDAYTTAHGRALTFTDSRDTWPDLTDGVPTLEIGDGEVVAAGVVVTATGTGKTVRVELTGDQTEELTEDRYDYNLVVTYPGTGTTAALGGDRATLASAEVVVTDREDQ